MALVIFSFLVLRTNSSGEGKKPSTLFLNFTNSDAAKQINDLLAIPGYSLTMTVPVSDGSRLS